MAEDRHDTSDQRPSDAQRDILLELSERMGERRSVSDTFATFAQAGAAAADFDCVTLLVMEPDGRFAMTAAAYPDPAPSPAERPRYRRRELALDVIASHPNGLEFAPAAGGHPALAHLLDPGISVGWVCPLLDGPDVIGVLTIGRARAESFDPSSTAFFRSASRILATAVRQDRHLDTLERQASRSALVNQLALLLNSGESIDHTFERFRQLMGAAIQFDAVYLMLTRGPADWRLAGSWPATYELPRRRLRHKEVDADVIQALGRVVDCRTRDVDNAWPQAMNDAGLKRCAVSVLQMNGETLGLLVFAREKDDSFGQEDRAFIGLIAALLEQAVANYRQSARARLAAARSQLLNEVALLLNEGESVGPLFDRILALLEQAVEFDYVGLMEATDNPQELRQVGSRPVLVRPAGEVTTFEASAIDRMFDAEGVVQYRTDRVVAGTTPELLRGGILRVAAVVLRHDGEPVGEFVLGRRKNHAFVEDECEFLLTLGNLLGQAIGNRRRVERIEREAARTALLNELSFLLNAGEPVESLFDRLPKLVRRAVPCEYVGLATIDPESRDRLRTIDWNARDGENLHAGSVTSREVALHLALAGTQNVAQFPLRPGITPLVDEMYEAGLRRSLLATLQDGAAPIGLLHISRAVDRPFAQEEMRFLEVVGRIFAQAVANQLRIARTAAEAEEERIIAAIGAVAAGVPEPRAVIAELVAPVSMFVPSPIVAFGFVEDESVRFIGNGSDVVAPLSAVVRRAIAEGQTVAYGAAQGETPEVIERSRQLGMMGAAHTLARSGGRLVGVLTVGTTVAGHEFNERSLRILRRVTQIVGPAMEAARASQRAIEEAEEQRIIAEIGAIASRAADATTLMQSCGVPLGRVVPQSTVSYMFVDAASKGYYFSTAPDRRFPLGPLGREAIATGQAWGGIDRIHPEHPGHAAGVQTVALTATYAGGSVAGLLGVTCAEAGFEFGERELRLLRQAAQIIGPAMESARTNELVARQSELYNLILSSLSEAVVVLSPTLQVVFENANGHRLTQVLDPERKLRNVDEHLPALPRGMRDDFLRAATEHVPARGRVKFELEGETVWYDYELVPLNDPNLALLAVASDVTAEVLREEEKARHNEQFAQASRLSALGELIGGVAHELNNPLTAILGFAEVMSVSASGSYGEELGIIQKEALRARNIVRDLLFIARPGPVAQGRVALTEVVGHVERLRRMAWAQQGIDVSVELGDHAQQVLGNENQLTQVLLNLVTNAEHAVSDTPDKRIRISTSRVASGELLLEVRDSGHGMDQETARRVFEPFFTTKQGQGTGLGLSLSYSIVSSHRGRIEVDSAPGHGTAFRVLLPMVADVPATPEKPPRPVLTRKARVLVVDDEPSLRKVCKRMITSMGHECEVAENAAAAVALVRRGHFDLVLCDYRLSGETADDVVRALAAIDPAIVERVVIATGATTDAGVAALTGRHNLRLVAKPYGFDEISQLLGAMELEAAS